MNFISFKQIQELNNLCWEPYATSTPLKTFSNKIRPLVQKQLVKPAGAVNALLSGGYSDSSDQYLLAEEKCQPVKKTHKNKSYYFDVLSSSEDENLAECSRAIRIKINAEKDSAKNKSLLKRKNLKKEEDKPTEEKIISLEKLNTEKSIKAPSLKKHSPLYKLKNKSGKVTSTRVTSTQVTTRGKSIKKNKPANSSENHSEIKNSIRNQVHSITNKDLNKENLKAAENNGVQITNSNDSFDKLNRKNFNKTSSEVNKLAEATEKDKLISSVNANEPGKKSALTDPNDFRQPKSSEVLKPQMSDALKLSLKKRKASKPSSPAGPAQKMKRKTKNSNPKPVENQSALHIWDDKKNLSHQLFSDSKKQELINSLDLTDVKTNEESHSSEASSKENKGELVVAESQNSKPVTDQNEKLRRPARRRQAPKEYWLPESPSPEPVTVNKKQQIYKELDKIKQVPLAPSLKSKTKSVKGPKLENKKKQCSTELSKAHALGELIVCNQNNQETPVDNLNGETKQTFTHSNKIKNSDANSSEVVGKKRQLRSNLRTRKTVQVRATEENKFEEKAAQVEDNNNKSSNPSDSTIPAVFKQLNQLSFDKEILEGCTKTDCWSLKNFKCGVLKIKNQSNLSSKNNQNIYFGGVLVVGNLQMKIGNREFDMKEGDMAFVPPLTEWTATNFSKTESVLYYWRGRFKTEVKLPNTE